MMKRPFILLLLTLFLFSATACSSPTAPLPTPDSGNSGFNSDSDGNGNQATDPDNNGTQTGDPDNNSGNSGGNSGGNSEKPQIGRNETILEKDANGNILKTEEIGSDGTKTHRSYTVAGKLKQEEIWNTDGSHIVRELNDKGLVAFLTSDTADGARTAIGYTYHANGTLATRRFDAAADAQLNYRWEEHTYDDRGNLLTHTKMQTNDTLCVSTYHSNGSYTSVFTDAEGNKYTEYWYKDDLLGGITIDGSEWGTKVPDDYSGFSGR